LTRELNIRQDKSNYRSLIHLDRLSITFRHWSGSTFQDIRNPDNIPAEQVFKNISLIHDKKPGPGAFYHTFIVYYNGLLVGKLHTATKVLKHELQFDFSKEIFYSFHPGFWYEVYCALKIELGLIYNNIMYLEISIDTNKDLVTQFAFYFNNCLNNKLRVSDRYFLIRKNTSVSVMSNGSSFIIDGSDNKIAIYNKSEHAEDYIISYFENNGFNGSEVFRIESRLTWNYIRKLRNKKLFDINVETLLDPKKLGMLFQVSTYNKITFKDKMIKTGNKNNRPVYLETSVMDEIFMEMAEIGKLNPEFQNNHYKDNNLIDENIIRQIYYRYLENGNEKHIKNFKAYAVLAGYEDIRLRNCLIKFNHRYRGNRTNSVKQRMEFALKKCPGKSTFPFNHIFSSLALKMKWTISGLM
jgi:hypothetical protein